MRLKVSGWCLGVVAGAGLAASAMTGSALADEYRHWHGDHHHFYGYDLDHWRHGNWWRGWHEGRQGWWWIVGGVWYWYPAPVYPFPDPYRPPLVPAAPPGQYWYYCPNPPGYYPYVPACPVPWQMMPAGMAAPPPQAVPMAPAPMPPPAMPPSPMPPSPMPPSPMPPGPIGQAAPAPGNANTVGGTVLGAIGGGVAGAQFGHGSGKLAATALGTLLGAFVGHEVGSSLDKADMLASQRAAATAYQAPLGQAISWSNPASGHSGPITPVKDGTDAGGHYCREFQQNVVVGGKTASAYGTACRQPDGTWKVVGQ